MGEPLFLFLLKMFSATSLFFQFTLLLALLTDGTFLLYQLLPGPENWSQPSLGSAVLPAEVGLAVLGGDQLPADCP